jgi:hypothetical protein
MNVTSFRLSQNSIVALVLLGRTDSTLHTALNALDALSFLLIRIEAMVGKGNGVADLARFGCRAASDAATDCREHADAGDVLGVVDCLARAISGHRTARNVLSIIAEIADTAVADLARLGINVTLSVLHDLGCEPVEEFHQ